VSEDLEALLLRALALRPADRYPTGGAFLDELGALMIREGHRATNNDLAAFLKDVIEAAGRTGSRSDRPDRHGQPASVVVLAVEASPPPRSLASPRTTLGTLAQEWTGVVAETQGEVWEREEGSMLVVWVCGSPGANLSMKDAIERAVRVASVLRKSTAKAGYRLSAGIAPGVARIPPDTGRPAEGWELAGPFYLARWMMNLSAHRGRVLLTEVGAKQAPDAEAALLGRICIQGNRYINLYEIA
jgi:hypothetical protein